MTEDLHFTYSKKPDFLNLCQGDVLEVSSELYEALKKIHPYFTKDQYKYYMVLTQSCDLVRRGNKTCKSPYITLAAIRTFDDFFVKTVIKNKYAEKIDDYVLLDKANNTKVFQLIERIYNNTEPDYFFLYKEDQLGFSESMVAYLKVSIALKSEDHYEKCLQAKKIELADEFKAKLGWLVGNIYSRVGTSDWESLMDSKQRKRMLEEEIAIRCIIGNKEQLSTLKSELEKRQIRSKEEAQEFLASIKVQTAYDKVIAAIEDTINTTGKKISQEEKNKLINAIKSRSIIKQLLIK